VGGARIENRVIVIRIIPVVSHVQQLTGDVFASKLKPINSLTFLKMSRNLLISKSNLFRTWWLYQTLMTIYSTGSGRPTGCSWPLAVFFHSL